MQIGWDRVGKEGGEQGKTAGDRRQSEREEIGELGREKERNYLKAAEHLVALRVGKVVDINVF